MEPVRLCDGLISYGVAWDLGVTVFSDFRWTEALAQRYIDECIAVTTRQSVLGGRGGLTYLAGAAPGPRERHIIVETLRRHGVDTALQRSAIVTDSVLVRGAATALSWVTGADVRTFPTADLADAARFTAFDEPPLTEQVERFTKRAMELIGVAAPR